MQSGQTARKTQRDPNLSLQTWLHLMKTAKAVEAQVSRRLQSKYGQSLPRFDVLSQLYRFEEKWVSTGKLAGKVMAASGNITALLDRMEAGQLIERRASPDDRRSYQVQMTGAGKRLFLDMAEDHAQWIDAAIGGLPETDRATLIELLKAVRTEVEKTR
ncbi:MAG: MarR family transcriptional regulator [Rhizobiales bacterium]|nr:MarR family transcriptional regulator [Hyphomicrobiales bacterium]